MRSVDCHGCVIVLTREFERQVPVCDERQLLALTIVHGIKLFKPFDLALHFAVQIGDINGFDVHDTSFLGHFVKWLMHRLTLS